MMMRVTRFMKSEKYLNIYCEKCFNGNLTLLAIFLLGLFAVFTVNAQDNDMDNVEWMTNGDLNIESNGMDVLD